jgi:hypothetical protein
MKKVIKSISTPSEARLPTKLDYQIKNFMTLKINEFRTSIIHNKKRKKCKNYINKHDENKTKSLYSLEKLKEKDIKKIKIIKKFIKF